MGNLKGTTTETIVRSTTSETMIPYRITQSNNGWGEYIVALGACGIQGYDVMSGLRDLTVSPEGIAEVLRVILALP